MRTKQIFVKCVVEAQMKKIEERENEEDEGAGGGRDLKKK